MTTTTDPTNITIIGTGDYAMAFDGQTLITIGDTDDVREAVLDRLGVNIEWCPMNKAILGTRQEPVDNSTLDKAMALIPAAEAYAVAEAEAWNAKEAQKAADRALAAAEANAARARKVAADAVDKAERALAAAEAAEAKVGK